MHEPVLIHPTCVQYSQRQLLHKPQHLWMLFSLHNNQACSICYKWANTISGSGLHYTELHLTVHYYRKATDTWVLCWAPASPAIVSITSALAPHLSLPRCFPGQFLFVPAVAGSTDNCMSVQPRSQGLLSSSTLSGCLWGRTALPSACSLLAQPNSRPEAALPASSHWRFPLRMRWQSASYRYRSYSRRVDESTSDKDLTSHHLPPQKAC